MTQFAAHDDIAIYATGKTAKEAITNARRDTQEPKARFETSLISDAMAAWIAENGWNASIRSFDIRDGMVVDTTEE
jgi:hypothetical protein